MTPYSDARVEFINAHEWTPDNPIDCDGCEHRPSVVYSAAHAAHFCAECAQTNGVARKSDRRTTPDEVTVPEAAVLAARERVRELLRGRRWMSDAMLDELLTEAIAAALPHVDPPATGESG